MFKPKLQAPLPVEIRVVKSMDIDWMAVKNKFFVQLLAPERSGNGFVMDAARAVSEKETPENARTWAQTAVINEVSGGMRFRERTVYPGKSFTRTMSYYVGPKKYSLLEELGNRQDEVMLYAWWEWFRWLCKTLLWTLNAIYKVIPNYGVAIILLTIIVRIIFWPVTHKGTESMKRMQKIQPLVAGLKEKYKDKPQKLQQETMALYKTHKVNPMAGCLPMVVQMPVFIALFNVLRSAVELRFASFLWVSDLSEPEGLLEGMIPLVGSLNILPLLMTATTVMQQRMTPTSGDPQQQKMMVFMPVFMLFIFYSMPSALVLYWTTSQFLSILQLLRQKGKKACADGAAGGRGAEVAPEQKGKKPKRS